MSQAPGNEIPHTLAALDWGGITCQVEILCIACLWHVEAKVLLQVGRLTRSPGAFCLTCGAPVREPTDIMRDVAAL